MNLEEALDYASTHLPEDWDIHIKVSKGWVSLGTPKGEYIPIIDEASDLVELVLAAVKVAHIEEESSKINNKENFL